MCGFLVGGYGPLKSGLFLGLSLETDTVVLEFLEAVRFGHLGSVNISYPGAATLFNCMVDDDCGIKDKGIFETKGHESRIPEIRKGPLGAEKCFDFLFGGVPKSFSPVQSFHTGSPSSGKKGLYESRLENSKLASGGRG